MSRPDEPWRHRRRPYRPRPRSRPRLMQRPHHPMRPRSRPRHTRPQGFTDTGYRQIYEWLLPGLEGAEKRLYFNRIATTIPLAAGLAGTLLGLAWGGPLGGLLGLGGGLWLGGMIAEQGRFYRH